MTHPLNEELQLALTLAAQCGPIALRYQTAGARILAMRHKPMGGGPITAADRELNELIVDGLAAEFPRDGILAEESPEDGSWRHAARCWYVDPIDGTREFAAGTNDWTVQLGLCVEGVPRLGVVSEPGKGFVSWAVHDGQSWQHGRRLPDGRELPLQPTHRPIDAIHLIGGKVFPSCRQHAIRKALGVDAKRARSVGSVGIRLASVARGDADAYVQAPGKTKMWDTCPPLCLVEAAGGVVTDLRGDALDYRAANVTHPRGVVASHGGCHDEILERLRPLADAWLDRTSKQAEPEPAKRMPSH